MGIYSLQMVCCGKLVYDFELKHRRRSERFIGEQLLSCSGGAQSISSVLGIVRLYKLECESSHGPRLKCDHSQKINWSQAYHQNATPTLDNLSGTTSAQFTAQAISYDGGSGGTSYSMTMGPCSCFVFSALASGMGSVMKLDVVGVLVDNTESTVDTLMVCVRLVTPLAGDVC